MAATTTGGKRATAPPALEFDGLLFWYLEWFDPSEDRCCFCRIPIPEEDVPLILWKKRGRQTLMTRLHFEPCGQMILRRRNLAPTP